LSTQPPIVRRKRKPVDWSTAVMAALVAGCALVVYLRDGRQRIVDILIADLDLFADMLPKVLAGCLIGAFVAALLSRELVGRWLGGNSGLVGLVIATLAGTIFPGGPITIYPVSAALLVIGADVGVAVAFITSWTLLGYARALVWELPFFGPDFVVWRIVAAVPLPILAGLLARLALAAYRARDKDRE
jgi:uncharacterized membrane protein YraQ (UPF0718 family)